MNIRQSLDLFDVSKSTYYDKAKNISNPVKGVRQINDERAKKCIRYVVYDICGGWVNGSEMLHYMILRHCGEHVNEKRIPRLLNEMGLKVSIRWNPYNGHDTKDHPCDSFTNLVKRRFYQGFRKIILTDITYLLYGSKGNVCYKCSFIDAFNGEELGTSVSKNMDVSFLFSAYEDMMKNHKGEFPEDAIIHSDHGSQFRSRAFRRRVKKDGFLQSMSNRGNSLDNAPMESFFHTFKDENSFKIMNCETFNEVVNIVMNYKNFYNNFRTHTGICGKIPAEFYAERSNDAVKPIIEARIAQNKGNAEQEYLLNGGADGQMNRDEKILSKRADSEKIKTLLIKARNFYQGASDEVKAELNDRRTWQNYPEMGYYKLMKGMF